MPPRPSTRVLLFHPERPPSASSIDWVAERLPHSRVLIPAVSARTAELPARTRHLPFAAPDDAVSGCAAETAALVAGEPAPPRYVVEAAVIALLEDAAVLVFDRELFRDLIALSCWSMNVPERPSDGLLAQHIGIASRMPAEFRDASGQAVDAVLSFDPERVRRVARARRLRARQDGPRRFGRLGKSAGRRPAIVYLDLLAAQAASRGPFAEEIRRLDRNRAEALLSLTAAVFC